ncbi:hypothetical protein CLU79DRAFT_776827 [Phycomyces nitens]|nr:hypothetical protein CLU79DRAFT_776827 [Phycomyces nitens]
MTYSPPAINKNDFAHHLPSLSSSLSPSPHSQHEHLNPDWIQDRDYTMEDSFLYLTECLAQDQEDPPFAMNTNPNELQIRVHGVPSTGAKSRVETQIKLCVQLVTNQDAKVQNWSYLRLHDNMLARSKQKKSQQKARMDGNLSTLLSDESNVLTLEAKVICASNEDKQVRMCHGCVKREVNYSSYKHVFLPFNSAREPNDPKTERPQTLGLPHQKTTIWRVSATGSSCSIVVQWSASAPEMPSCPQELLVIVGTTTRKSVLGKLAWSKTNKNDSNIQSHRVRFTMRNDRGTLVATGDSPPILITDDHKSLKQRGRKRSRQDTPDTATPSRRTSVTESPSPEISNISPKDLPRWLQCLPTPTTSLLDFIEQSPGPQSILSIPTPLDDPNTPSEEWPYNQRRRTLSTPSTPISSPQTPHIERIVPGRGPTYGGAEITILGSGFSRDLTCMFGEHPAKTVYWNTNTLVCVLPPATTPGPVVVTFKEHPLLLGGQDITLFTYYDAGDQALLELALQVVGLKMTGKLQNAKQVAMRIVQGDSVPVEKHKGTHGHTMLHIAALLGYEDLVAALIPATTNIDLPDKNGCTAFHLACTTPSLEVCKLLLEAGADPLASCSIESVRENTSNVLKMLASLDMSNSFLPKHDNIFQSSIKPNISRRCTLTNPPSSLSLSDLPLLASLLSIVQG